MKALTILSIVQTGFLILLFGRTIALEDELAVSTQSAPTTTANNPLLSPPADNSSRPAYLSLDEDQLRRVIREELGAYASHTPNANGQVSELASYDPASAPEKQYQLEQVSQRIEYFASVGNISGMEMGNLQMEIARLDEAGRREMLGKLTKAMNSGAIDGRF